ncbi:hypothetical protein D3C78_1848990 [compost metagenome]
MIAALDRLQNLKPVHFREFEIKKNHGRITARAVMIATGYIQIVECFRTVACHHHLIRQLAFLKSGQR